MALETDNQVNRADPLIVPFLAAASEIEAERGLESLIERHAMPVLRAIVRRKFSNTSDIADADDAVSEARVQLTVKLMRLRGKPDDPPIASFVSYAAMVAYRSCDLILRRRYPERARLKSRVRYIVTHSAKLRVWDSAGDILCGVRSWKAALAAPAARAQPLDREEMRRFAAEGSPRAGSGLPDLPALVEAAVAWRRKPVELDDLVAMIAEATGVSAAAVAIDDSLADKRSIESEVEQLAYLRSLWDEVRQLPSHQCVAVLLNLRDTEGRGVIELLPRLGIASIRAIAQAMEMAAEDLASIWNDLPIDDNRIADLLGATRQQVIGYRKKARERLERRMRQFDR